jgi:hypothetical protein
MDMDDELQTFENLRVQFGLLMDELQEIREEWMNIHKGPFDTLNELRHNELLTKEVELFKELQHLLDAVADALNISIEEFRIFTPSS